EIHALELKNGHILLFGWADVLSDKRESYTANKTRSGQTFKASRGKPHGQTLQYGLNPPGLAKHFLSDLAQRTVLIDDGKVFQLCAIKDGVQYCDSIDVLALHYPGFAHLDALLHRVDAGCKAANGSCCGRNRSPAQLQLRAVFHRSRQQYPR